MTKTKKRMQTGGGWNLFGSTPAETERETDKQDNSLLPNGVSNMFSKATSSLEGLITPTSAAPSVAAPSVAAPLVAVAAQPVAVKKTWAQTFGINGGSRGRRRRRCTKKHRHSSACKRMRKGKRTKGRKRR